MSLNEYIGIPFLEKGRTREGLDCWGLVALVLFENFGVKVPSYTEDYTTSQDWESVSALINRESIAWPEVPLAEARPGDVLILRVRGQPWHCGLVVTPNVFIHSARHVGTVLARWDSLLWERRIIGVHRHPQLMEPVCR